MLCMDTHRYFCIWCAYAGSRFGVVVHRGVLVNGQRGRVQCDGVPARLVLLGRGLDRLRNERKKGLNVRTRRR